MADRDVMTLYRMGRTGEYQQKRVMPQSQRRKNAERGAKSPRFGGNSKLERMAYELHLNRQANRRSDG